MKKLTLYHETSKGGFKQWSIWIEPDKQTVTVEWGLVDGSLQRSSDTAKPKGKVGTKSYKDEETCARENYDRQIRKKREEGYRESMDAAESTDWLLGLNKNFVPAKPLTKQDEEDTYALERADKLWFQRKRDGRRHLALKTRNGQWRIYSRRIEELTGHLAHIVEALSKLPVPCGTILDGEVLVVGADGRDDYKVTGRFTNPASDPAGASALARKLNAQYMIFDVLYWAGEAIWEQPYQKRYTITHDKMMSPKSSPKDTVFFSPNLTKSFDALKQQARDERWEGLVIWQHDMPSFVRDGGKPKRCNAAKWKPIQERDFVATGWFYGSGQLSSVVGGFFLSEYAPDGTLRKCGKVGTGLDDEMRREALSWDYPCVVAIKFDQQEPTGKLRFPVVLKKHEDKTPDECIGPELDDDEE